MDLLLGSLYITTFIKLPIMLPMIKAVEVRIIFILPKLYKKEIKSKFKSISISCKISNNLL